MLWALLGYAMIADFGSFANLDGTDIFEPVLGGHDNPLALGLGMTFRCLRHIGDEDCVCLMWGDSIGRSGSNDYAVKCEETACCKYGNMSGSNATEATHCYVDDNA